MVRAREQSGPEAARSRRPKVIALNGNKLTRVLQSSQPGSRVPACVSGDRGEGTSHLPVWVHCLLALAQGWNWVFWSMLCCELAQKVPACSRLPRASGSRPSSSEPQAQAVWVLPGPLLCWEQASSPGVFISRQGVSVPLLSSQLLKLIAHVCTIILLRMPCWAHSCPVSFGPNC